MPKQLIREATPTPLEATTPNKSGRLEITLITPGWGSSGYYSAPVLKAAAEAGIWEAGHQMFADHPGEAESYDRPERSIKDLAATLTETARWDEEGQRVVAEAHVFPHFVELLTDEEFAKAIGVSIRAYAESRHGEAEGRKGSIMTRLDEAISTDFVTRAGRGGAIAAVMESARPSQVVDRAVAHGVEEATANDTRDALQGAVTAEYGGEKVWVWVRDFDDTRVWFALDTPDTSAIYEQAYVVDDEQVALDGEPTEVRARTEYVPVTPTSDAAESGPQKPTKAQAPAGQSTATESEETHMATTEIEESRLAQLETDAERVQSLESERNTARTELANYKAREAARPAVMAKVGESDLPARRQSRIVEAALETVTVGDDGKVDAEALTKTVESLVTDAREELAELAESLGVGTVTGFGQTKDTTTVVESADPVIASAFGRTVKEA